MNRLLAALVVGLPLVWALGSADARADLVQTSDGVWHGVPRDKDLPPLGPKDSPSPDHLRQTADQKVEATYETVKMRGWSSPAGLVKQIVTSEEETVASFKEGFAQLGGNLWQGAIDSFTAAAEETTGFAKQQALYFRLRATQAAPGSDVATVKAAIDELLAASPSSFYFAEAQVLRAKIDSGDPAALGKALDAIKSQKGMNPRDVYRAEYMRTFLLLERARKFDEAKAAYEALIAQIDKGDAAAGALVRQLAQVAVGNCNLRANPPKLDEALKAFAKAVAESNDPDVLASAYLGLGNLSFGTAKQLQDGKKMEEAQAKLTEATTHYLRVTLHLQEDVTENAPVLEAYENQAKAFVALFNLSDGKDCVAAERAYKAYFLLHDLLQGTTEQKRIAREANAFNAERKQRGCK
jgi:tetratricopeptide (TPR) repeat protein